FLVGGLTFAGAINQCLVQEHHIFSFDGGSPGFEAFLKASTPYAWTTQPSIDRILRNCPSWADKNGLLKGQTIGLYSPDDSASANTAGEQDAVTKSFRASMRQLGYEIKVDETYGSAPNDALAVQKFRAAGV